MGVEEKQEMNTVFCYDAMNRLTMENRREGGEKYAYDLNGNRLRKQRYHYALNATGNMDSVIDGEESYCYNERNELTERRSLSAVTAYLYDENGSLIREKEGEKETGYRYDLLNRQTHVQLPDGRVQDNLYDGEGLRAGLKEGSTVSTFLFYNGEILAECNGDSMPIRRHLRGFGLSGVEDISTGTSHAYHQDEQGSTAYVTGSTGETENLYSYDGFGNILESREDIANRILYTGQQYDQETGQYYLRARYYNPVIGRFTQEDTYRGDGLNLYAYCDNNPVMYYDPSGHKRNNNCNSGNQEDLENTNSSNVSPALEDSPYNPDVVDSRVKPDYVPNPAHDANSQSYNPNKTPEPNDAANVYQNSVRGGMGEWYGTNENGEIYQFFYDNAGGVHYAGTISKERLAQRNYDVVKLLGIVMKGK